MQNGTLLMVGGLKAGPLTELTQEYIKRLRQRFRLELKTVEESRFRSPDDAPRVLKEEAARLRKQIDPDAFLIVLDADGKSFSSVEFANQLERWSESGARPLTFVIGGPLGLDPELKKEASVLLSLSKMTVPHDLARVVLLEQVYRAMTILKGKVYHY